jgi:hypothetical protein
VQDWTPVAVLPNLHARHAVEGEFVAFAPIQDARVQAYCGTRPKFADFISRFTDAFEKPLQPLIYIVRNDAIPKLTNNSALMAFRDLVAACAVTRARTLNFVYPNRFGASYSNYFWLHPWMQNDTNDHLTAHTPALLAFHVVEKFHGQSSPELSEMELDEIDEPLFKEMMRRWARHYLGKRQRWQDRALFRSLNMAFHASQIPAGVGPTMYDLGRIIALWVSAFEILAHPRVKVIAAKQFGLTLLADSHPGHDARDADNRLVQIKLTASKHISMYANCDRLIVMWIECPQYARLVYDGDGAPIWAMAGKLQKNGQKRVSLSAIRRYAGC